MMDFVTEQNRIYKQDGQGKLLAEVLFPGNADGTVTITRTFVDESLRGQGIAGDLLKALASELWSGNKKARPVCSYAVKWFAEHPEYGTLLA